MEIESEAGELPSESNRNQDGLMKNNKDNDFNSIFINFIDNKKIIDDQLIQLYNSQSNNNSNDNKPFFNNLYKFIIDLKSDLKFDFIFILFNKFINNKWKNRECFSEIFNKLIINQDNVDNSSKLTSILNYSIIFNENGNEENLKEFFNILFSSIKWDNRIDIINNSIEFLSSILSISINFGFSNILNLTSNWLINFKRIEIPNIVKETWDLNNNNNNNNNLNEINQYFIISKILKSLLNDHIISNESSNNFELLPNYSIDFTNILLIVILSYYLNPFNRDQVIKDNSLQYYEFIIPKLTSLLSNYWLIPNNSNKLLFKSNLSIEIININNNELISNNLLKELITICIFSNHLNNNLVSIIKPYLEKIISIILDNLYIDSSSKYNQENQSFIEIDEIEENQKKIKKEFIISQLPIEYFNLLINELNKDKFNNNNNNNNSSLTSSDILYSTIIILSNTMVDINNDYSLKILQSLKNLKTHSKFTPLLEKQIIKINNYK